MLSEIICLDPIGKSRLSVTKASIARQNLFFLFIVFLLLQLTTFAQADWSWQNPLPQGNTLQGVSFSDDNNGIAVGNYGTIIRTEDGGNSWVIQVSGTLEILRDVSFTDANNGTVVGDQGIILNTKDGGQTWNLQTSGTINTLYGVSFSDAYNGTAVGFWETVGTVFRTTDGGSTWVAQQTSSTGFYGSFFSVSFADVNNGTIVGADGTVEHTTDGGNTWVAQSSGTTKNLRDVSFYDANNGITVGSGGTILRTNDGGANWIPLTITSRNLYSVSYIDANNCTIGGKSTWIPSAYDYESTVIRITDGGTSWYIYYQVGENDFYGVSNNTLVGGEGEIYHTSNNGTTWVAQRTGPVRKLRGASFTSSNIGTVVGHNGTILRTTNGGSTWASQLYDSPSTNGSINDYLKAVSFSDANHGFVVSGNAFNDGSIVFYEPGIILRTTNGGTIWVVKYNNLNAAFNGVSSPSANICFAVGVYKILDQGEYVDHAGWASTTDGGASWRNRYFTSITDPLTDVSFTDNNIGTMVGHKGRIMQTTDGGYNWNTKNSRTSKNLHGVCFTDANNGTVVGDDGTILRTNNGGEFWALQSSGTTENLYGVSFVDANYGSVVGSNGIILLTTNGGITWEIHTSVTGEYLYAVSFADENIGNTVGDNGTILRTINGGVTSVFEERKIESPKGYILSQNYPNPFNPITIIEYDIKERSFVELKIYDVLGREVNVLVNEEQVAGSYKAKFDASGLTSGIYFYRFQAANYIKTKKMILLK